MGLVDEDRALMATERSHRGDGSASSAVNSGAANAQLVDGKAT